MNFILFFIFSISSYSQDEYKTIQTNNTYAELVYKALGNVGYWIYYVCSLITLYGSNIGSMVYILYILYDQVVMTDFLECIPFSHNKTMRRLIAQIILTVLCIILCLLKDPKYISLDFFDLQNVGWYFFPWFICYYWCFPYYDHVSLYYSISIIHSFGFVEYKFDFAMSDLWPKSIEGFLQEFGVIVYCMGFILFLLTQYVCQFIL